MTVRAARPRALLALLAASGGRRPAVDLAEELWPAGPSRDSSALKVLVARANSMVREKAEPRLIVFEAGHYRFAPDVEVDALEYAASIGSVLVDGAAPTQMRLLLDRWDGSPCPPEWDELPTVSDEFRRLASIRLELLVRYVEACLDAVPRPEIESLVTDALQHDPYDERLWVLLVKLRYRQGRQAAALRAFDDARVRLVDDLGVEPGPELVAVRDAVLRHDPSLQHRDAVTVTSDRVGDEALPSLGSLLSAAATAARSDEIEEANALLDVALDRLQSDGDAPEQDVLRVALARAEIEVLAGNRQRAERLLDHVVERAIELDDLPLLVEAAIGPPALGAAGILGASTTHARLERAHLHLDGRDTPRAVELRSRLLRAARRAGDHQRHDDLAQSLVTAARESGLPTDLAHALYAAHKARYPHADPDAELASLREAEVLAANRDTELWVLAVLAQAVMHLAAGRVDAGNDSLSRALEVATRARLPRRAWDSMTLRAGLTACEGRLRASAEEAERAFAFGCEYDISDAFGTFAMQQFVVLWHEDRIEELGRAVDALEGADHGIPDLIAARGLVAAARGDRQDALACIDECRTLLAKPDVDDHRLVLLCLVAQVAVEAGADVDTIGWLLDELAPYAGTMEVNFVFVLGPVDRFRGVLLGAAGRIEEAIDLLDQVARFCRGVGWVLHEALARADLGRLASAEGDPGGADELATAVMLARSNGLRRIERVAVEADNGSDPL